MELFLNEYDMIYTKIFESETQAAGSYPSSVDLETGFACRIRGVKDLPDIFFPSVRDQLFVFWGVSEEKENL